MVDAEEKIKDLDWKLVDDSGNTVAVEQDKLIKPGMQIGRAPLQFQVLANVLQFANSGLSP